MVDCMESTAQYIKRHSDFLRENIKDDTLSDFLTEAVCSQLEDIITERPNE